jgi:hypothetical protein
MNYAVSPLDIAVPFAAGLRRTMEKWSKSFLVINVWFHCVFTASNNLRQNIVWQVTRQSMAVNKKDTKKC